MTLKEQLLQEKIHTKKAAVAIAETASSSKEKFAELMHCFLSNEYRLAQRAAWSVSYAVSRNEQLLLPYLKDVILQLLRNDVHNAVVRNSIRILKQITIPKDHHGEVLNACFVLAESPETPVAIKAFALSALYKLYLIYPDIEQELKAIAESCLDEKSAAVKNVSKKILIALYKGKTPRVND